MTPWLIFIPLTLAALAFVLWRVFIPLRGENISDDDLAANRGLFREKLAQLRAQRDSGEIDAAQFHALELEYQRQFLADSERAVGHTAGSGGGRWLVWGAALLIPVVTVMLYLQLGATAEIALRAQLERRAELFAAGRTDAEAFALATDRVLESMEALAEKRPQDPTYHVLLARLYADQGDLQQAIPHYLKATALLPEDGNILAEYAQVLFFASENRMSPRIEALTTQALELSPQNHTALSLAGIASFNEGDYHQALVYWNRALAQLPAGAPSRVALESGVAAARERLGESPAPEPAGGEQSLRLQVTLGENVDVPPDTTVFVYARAWQGSPMPLAIARLKVADLPAEILLTESMAMTPAMSLASVEQVEAVARVSLSGSPTPAAGDYQAAAGPIDVADQEEPVSLSIISPIAQ